MMVTTWAGGDGRFLDIQPLRRAGGSCGGCGPGHFFQGMCWLAICRGRLSTLHSTFMSGFCCWVSPCASAPCTSAAPRTFVRSPNAMGISSRWKPMLFTPRNTAWLVNKLDHLRILSHTTRCNCCPRLPSLVSKGSAVAAPSAVEEALHCPGCGWAGLPSWAVWRCPAGSPDLCGRLRDEAGYRGDRSPRSRRQSIEKRSLTGLSSCREERNSSLQCLASKHL